MMFRKSPDAVARKRNKKKKNMKNFIAYTGK